MEVFLPCEYRETTSGAFHWKELDVWGTVNFLVPAIVLREKKKGEQSHHPIGIGRRRIPGRCFTQPQ